MRNYFKQDNRKNWSAIIDNLKTTILTLEGDWELEVKELKKKRSGDQLKAYFVLIESVRRWMNSQGNTYTKENISDWFKIQTGFSDEINGVIVPKSIANKSDCSRQDMEALINTILVFGSQNGIPNCEIRDDELDNLLKFYDK